jgi:DNA modification methylase
MVNEYIVGDNLKALQGLETKSIDFIYIDPTYNTGRQFGDFDDKYDSMKSYSDLFLKERLVEARRVLKVDGNIAVHVEPRISHHIRNLLDDVFGETNFQNEIIWKSGNQKKTSKKFARFHDNIIVYSVSKNNKFNAQYKPYDDEYRSKNTIKMCDIHNKEYVTSALINHGFRDSPRPNLTYEWNGTYAQWWCSKERMEYLHENNRLLYPDSGVPRIKKFLEEMSGVPVRDIWLDIPQIQGAEKLKYSTQKPVKLIERLVESYTNKGDLVLDFFAGSGTVGRACINTERDYLLVDLNPEGKSVFDKSIEK